MTDTECIELTLTGTGNPYELEADIIFDPDSEDCINCGPDGVQLVFDPASEPCLYCGPQGIRLAVSETEGNQLVCSDDGLLVPAAAPAAVVEALATYATAGELTVETGTLRFRFPFAVTLLGTTAAVNTAPTGASIILDVNKNGSTIYTTTANRPTILAGAFATATEPTPNITAMAAGDYLTVDIDQVGSTVAGSDLTVFIRYSRP